MSRVCFFIDGFNFYHAINDHAKYHRYKWTSFSKLANCYLLKTDSVSDIFYFTTLATWDQGKMARHRVFIKAQEAEGVKVIYGEFKRKEKFCPRCHRTFRTVEEKQTDVNIAIALFQQAVLDRYDKAIIISGDTDLIPAIKAVTKTFPAKSIGAVIPIGRASEDLKKNADFHHKMKEHQLLSSRMSDIIQLADGTTLTCPPQWK